MIREPQHPDIEPLTGEERRAIRALQRLAKRWPRSLWVYGGESMHLQILKALPDGTHAADASGCVDQRAVVGGADIPNDGGGW